VERQHFQLLKKMVPSGPAAASAWPYF